MLVTFHKAAEIAGASYSPGDTASLNGDNLVAALFQDVATIAGESKFWDDLRFPAQAVNPPGAAGDPTWDTTHLGWSFSGSAAKELQVVAQMPHNWAPGTAITPHIHIKTTDTSSSKKSVWTLQYRVANPTDASVPEFTPITINPNSPAGSGSYSIFSFGEIAMNGFRISAILDFIITRDPTDDLDTDTNAIVLKEFDLHYQVDGIGSAQELVK